MNYNHKDIEAKWQKYWSENQAFKAENANSQSPIANSPKYYVLDMFPYPSGAGLHVGHPLGYIASDIFARYKRHKGFNVLHPQGYDSFGLPAEQYAIQTGQHPEKTTRENIARYREQLDKIGFSFDWSREVRTSNPDYYKWTQWIFIQLFNSWYNQETDKAEDISDLIKIFEKQGNTSLKAVCDEDTPQFSAEAWNGFSSEEKQRILLKYRLTYLAETEVNWCPALGTVLANDEIVNGVSERGGHPVIRKKMTQWSMRITAYAERLLQGLDAIDWSESIKESQRNWIGKSQGATIFLPLAPSQGGGTAHSAENSPLLGRGAGGEDTGGEEPPKFFTGGNNAHLLIDEAKRMRKEPTQAEEVLWQTLRNSQLGEKFRRQHLIDDFIVDFVCLSKNLVVEVDGGYHDEATQKEYDEQRTLILNEKGFDVICFTNEEVMGNLQSVIEKIKTKLSRPTLPLGKNINESISSNSNSPLLGRGAGGEDVIMSEQTPLSLGEGLGVRIFTTRPDTIFGVTYLTLAPEHPLVKEIVIPSKKAEIEAYIEATSKRSERDRMADTKTISGVFTGAYAVHPITGKNIPIWIGDYVLAGYGTGAVMAVPAGDERDYAFAKHFAGAEGMPEIINIFDKDISENAFTEKEGMTYQNSGFLNNCSDFNEAFDIVVSYLESRGYGERKTNYRLRDAVFSRQRYWGEPFPIYYVNGLPQTIDPQYLPIELPQVEKYLPTEDGQPPLGNAKKWWYIPPTPEGGEPQIVSREEFEASPYKDLGGELELNTMPGWAGSSWYWLRYMDAHNEAEFVSPEAVNYWQSVDLYIGGSEHATGHLLYSRFWNKFLKDRGFIQAEEPFKKLINQGMILGTSAFVYRLEGTNTFVSKGQIGDKKVQPIHVDVSLVNASSELDVEGFRNWRPDFKDAEFILENGKILPLTPSQGGGTAHSAENIAYESNSPLLGRGAGGEVYIVGHEVEKMSKSKYNVVNPDDICEQYGADTLRLYEMFLGPLEQAKPWNTAGITGVSSFLKKFYNLYFEGDTISISDENPTKEELKILHTLIKKVEYDIEHFSFNTSVSAFMIAVNELQKLKCNKRAILEPMAVLISPYAPHIAEELWQVLGHNESISRVPFPIFEEKYLVEDSKEYPVSFNGKVRFKIELPLDLPTDEVEKIILADERTQTQLGGNPPKKIIVVKGKIVNVVV